MILNLDLYRQSQKASLRSFITLKDHQSVLKTISEYAMMSNTPIVAVAYYAGEIVGFTDEIKSMIDRFMKFYNIEEVKGLLGQ